MLQLIGRVKHELGRWASRSRGGLSEGSSLTAREVVPCLGPVGYRVEALDLDPLCVARLSGWPSGFRLKR